MEKGVIRFEANVSVRPKTPPGREPAPLGTRTEVKNLNSFRAMERAILYEIERQSQDPGRRAARSSRKRWAGREARGQTYSQRSKEEAHDYRYFPEPDLPPLVVEPDWVRAVSRRACPSCRTPSTSASCSQYGLSSYNAWRLTEDQAVADYFEQAAASALAAELSPTGSWAICSR